MENYTVFLLTPGASHWQPIKLLNNLMWSLHVTVVYQKKFHRTIPKREIVRNDVHQQRWFIIPTKIRQIWIKTWIQQNPSRKKVILQLRSTSKMKILQVNVLAQRDRNQAILKIENVKYTVIFTMLLYSSFWLNFSLIHFSLEWYLHSILITKFHTWCVREKLGKKTM